jgi:ribosomal protein S18 acetylase RimI-like enzyme
MLYLLFVSLLNGAIAFASLKRQRTGVLIHGRKAIVGAKSNIHSTTLLNVLLPRISVSRVQSNVDILSLADLRYKEWILQDDINGTDESKASPSQHSFRLATAEICQERSKDDAIDFLAKYYNGNEEIVGAAELSPIETRGCIRFNNDTHLKSVSNTPIAMYATDIVTSSSHRRLGIGSKLMNELEDEAWRMGCRFVFLHVEYDNAVAIGFYHRLGYLDVQDNVRDDIGVVTLTFTDEGLIAVPTTSLDTLAGENKDGTRIDEQVPHHETIIVDTRQLAANAGTTGQLLMVKKLKEPNTNDKDDIQSETSASKAAGFGGNNAGGFGSKRKTVKKKKK